MSERINAAVIEPGQEYEIDFFHPGDAPGVARLFHAVYGDGYPVKTFTDPKLLVEENGARRIISSVARTTAGDIVGHCALYCSAPFKNIYESGAAVIEPNYRAGQIGFRLLEHSYTVAAGRFGVETLFGEAVCNHVIMQKICAKFGWTVCALEVDLMPAEAYVKEKSASDRVSTLLAFFIVNPKEQVLYLPDIYKEPLSFIYNGLNHECRFEQSGEELPVEQNSRIETVVFDFAQVSRFIIHEAGSDFDEELDKHEKAAVEKGSLVHQAWLKLSWPWVGRVVEILRSRGYFFGGPLPRWFDEDGFLMQKILGNPCWDGIQILGERSATIRDIVRADWEAVRQVSHG